MDIVTKLDIALKQVCSAGAVEGVRKVSGEWVVDWSPSATEDDKVAAAAVIMSFNPDAPTADQVKAECTNRIYAVCNQVSQMNLIAARAAGLLDTTQQATYNAGLNWINQMRSKCSVLISNGSTEFAADSSWPACPAAFVAMAKAF